MLQEGNSFIESRFSFWDLVHLPFELKWCNISLLAWKSHAVCNGLIGDFVLPEYEYDCETDSDKVEEFLPFFLLEGSRYSRLCQGSCSKLLSTYHEHFRLTPETVEELGCRLANCPEIPLGHSWSEATSFNKQAVTYFLVVLRDTRMSQVNFQTDSMLQKVQYMCLADMYVMPQRIMGRNIS